jgi:hypothetical protein
MSPTLTIIAAISLPIALAAIGIIGIVRRPALAVVLSLAKASVKAKMTDFKHTSSSPTRLKNFLAQLKKDGETSVLYALDCEYSFMSPPGQLACELHLNSAQLIAMSFDGATESLKVDHWSNPQSLMVLPGSDGKPMEFVVPQPSIVYKRVPAEGGIAVIREGKETEYVETTGTDELELIAASRRSLLGSDGHLVQLPSVTSQLLSGPPDMDMLVQLDVCLKNATIDNALGSIAVGASRWPISSNDTIELTFPAAARPRVITLNGGASIKFGPPPNLRLLRRNSSYIMEIGGPAKRVVLNGERIRDTAFSKTLYWCLAAIAAGVVSGLIGLYFTFIEKLLT